MFLPDVWRLRVLDLPDYKFGRLPMVTVTEEAAKELRAQLLAATSNPEIGLRLMPALGGRFMLTLDTEQSGDQVVEHQGAKVLLIGIEYLRALEGCVIDCYDTREGAVLFVTEG